MIEVELPDGTVVEFPEGTPNDAIQRALASVKPPAPAIQTHGFQGREPTTAPPADPIVSEARQRLSALPKWRQHVFGGEQAVRGLVDGVKDITVGLSPEEEHDVRVRRAMEREAGGASSVSRFLGDMAIAAPASLAVAKGASMLPKARGTANLIGQTGVGAAFGAAQPTVGNESRADNATLGGVFGFGGQLAGNVVAKGIQGPIKMAKEAANLTPSTRQAATLGQLADRDTMGGRIGAGIEERLRSIPAVGQIIDKKRDAGLNAWRDDIIAKGTPDGYTPVGQNTHEKLDDIYQEFNSRYGQALKGTTVQPSQVFSNARGKILTNPRSGLPDHKVSEVQQAVDRYYDSLFTPSRSTGQLVTEGDQAKKFEAFLSAKARNLRKATNDPYAADMASMYEDLERAWSTSYRRQIGSGARQQLKPLDQKYAPYKTVERAAAFTGSTGGDFSPAQLNTAVANRTPRGSFGRGQGILQREATEGKKLFMDRLPNSGTADRALTAAAVLGAVEPNALIATAIGIPAMASKTGKNIMLGETAAQKMLRLLRADQAATLAGTPLALTQMRED